MDAFGVAGSVWLPIAFAGLMGFAILVYVILDGYDLGVGLLMATAERDEQDVMVAAIGPFWDANETWLVLGVGLLLVAFPIAHGVVLTAFYLPVAVMLFGLVLRGVAFEFRHKVETGPKVWWTRAFILGSALASLAQGFMLGLYVMGLETTRETLAFAVLSAVGVTAGYCYLGATWIILKTDSTLQYKAVRWARASLVLLAVGMLAVSLATPLVSNRIFERWFAFPQIVALAPVPLMTAGLVFGLWVLLGRMPYPRDRYAGAPFAGGVGLFVLGFGGLAYSFYPYVVPERLTIWQAASAPESLLLILIGTGVMIPIIAAYSAFNYWVFRGKATSLTYH